MRLMYPDGDPEYFRHRRFCLELLATIRETTARIEEIKNVINIAEIPVGQPDRRKRLLERALRLITTRRMLLITLTDVTGEHPDPMMRAQPTTESCNPFDNLALRYESLRLYSCRHLGIQEDHEPAFALRGKYMSSKRDTMTYFKMEDRNLRLTWWKRIKKILNYQLF